MQEPGVSPVVAHHGGRDLNAPPLGRVCGEPRRALDAEVLDLLLN
jgi:hypothetical protein